MSKQTESTIFTLTDFRDSIKAWATARGRGAYRRISSQLGIHTTLMSQVISGRKCLTEEQATKLCAYMGLSPLETDYFLKLVQMERAGTEALKEIYRRHLEQLRAQANEVKGRIPLSREMSEQDRAIFYSSWQYGLVRLLTSMSAFQTPVEIAARLGISVSRAQEILSFLASRKLCTESGGRFVRTAKNTHVEASSPFSIRHHQNWRARTLASLEQMSPGDLAFTAPVALAKKDIPKIRTLLLETIANAAKVIEASPAEEVVYLGVDWIRI